MVRVNFLKTTLNINQEKQFIKFWKGKADIIIIQEMNEAIDNKSDLFIKNDKIIFDPVIRNIQNKDTNFTKLKNNNFLLFSCRDNAYKEKNHGTKLNYHSYRNESLINYEKSFVSLKKQFNIVRFGSVVSEKIKDDGIFDYSFSEDRNEINDLWLMKNCYIYIGTGSGPHLLAMNYQKPIVYTN